MEVQMRTCDNCGDVIGESAQCVLGDDGRVESCESCEPERVLALTMRVERSKKPQTYKLVVSTANRSTNPEWQVYRVRFAGAAPADAPRGSDGYFGLVGAVGSHFPTRAVICVAGTWARHERYGLQLRALGRATYCVEDRKGFLAFAESIGYATVAEAHPSLAVQQLLRAADFALLLDALNRGDADEREKMLANIDVEHYRIDWLSEQFRRYVGFREAFDFLASIGCEDSASAIVDALGEETVEVVKSDCYIVAELPSTRVSLRKLHSVADALKYALADTRRVAALIIDCMQGASNAGHTRVALDALFDASADTTKSFESLHKLALSHESILDGLDSVHARQDLRVGSLALKRERLTIENGYIYLRRHYEAETNIAQTLVAMAARPANVVKLDAVKWGMEPTDEQRSAVESALAKQVCVLTGGPGVGKTTVTRAVLSGWHAGGERVLCLAPTARAAKRMTEATGQPAMTIHRAIMAADAIKDSLDASAIVVDECSMVDNLLMERLLKKMRPSARLLLVGDVDQLPSVSAGRVLHDIVRSGVVPVARLTKMMRSVEDGAMKRIPQTARDILDGKLFDVTLRGSDVNFLQLDSISDIETAVCRAFAEWMPAKYGYQREDILVLSPQRGDMRKENYRIGVNGLNAKLQSIVNPPTLDGHEHKVRHGAVRIGDRVRHTKNDYELGAYNGDIGTVVALERKEFAPESGVQTTTKKVLVVVDYGDKQVGYAKSQLSMLDLAYAGTVHSSQGSEAPAVIIVVHSSFAWTQTRNLIYTAHTRARRNVLYVGQQAALQRAINTTRDERRETGLAQMLIDAATWA